MLQRRAQSQIFVINSKSKLEHKKCGVHGLIIVFWMHISLFYCIWKLSSSIDCLETQPTCKSKAYALYKDIAGAFSLLYY